MNPKLYHSIRGGVSALMVAGAILLPTTAHAQEAAVEDVQILTRGPVHEAFAESVSFDPQPGLIISTRPPDPLEELPPEQQPEGDNVTWIPGYWAWDDEQTDFIWISGIWRNLPPGRQWVPGYWSEIQGDEFQWTSGYWADSQVEEVSYIATAPPRSVDVGPNIAAPSDDHNWIPGNWHWSDSRYLWRPGYWLPMRNNWTWVPSRYSWTRRGYVYVDGYWDYAVASRGVLFAPVHFGRNVYSRPDYYYTPSIVVALSVFSNHLFVRPRSGHYYFGDYYEPRYRDSGFYASYSWHSGRRGYDPIYAYDRWDHRRDRNWENRRRDDFNYFRDNENARPPRTWAAMRDIRGDRTDDGRDRRYAESLSDYSRDDKSKQRFRKVSDDRRKEIVSQSREMRNFSQERRQVETRERPAGDDDSRKTTNREKRGRSPIVGREAARMEKSEAPPKRPETRGGRERSRPEGEAAPQTEEARRDRGQESTQRKDATPERKAERGESPRDGAEENAQRTERGARDGKQTREMPRRETEATKETPERRTNGRESQPKAEATPKREAQPKAQPREERERQPQDRTEAAPKREAPKAETRKERERQPQARTEASPKREAPKAEPRKMQERQPQPRTESRPAPERKPEARQAPQREQQSRTQAAPKREAQPKPEVRRAPQQRVESRPAPQPRAQTAPQRQAQPRAERKVREAPRQEARPQPAPQQRQQPQQRQPQPAPQKEEKKSEEREERKGSRR